MRTKEEVREQIEKLKMIRPLVANSPRRHSEFGDDHLESLSVQIDALERGLTYDDIIDWDGKPHSEASEAIEWRDGDWDGDGDLADEYAHIIKRVEE